MEETKNNLIKGRRKFLKQGSLALLAISIPGVTGFAKNNNPERNLKIPESTLVVWYSQTGNTERAGRVISRTLENQGIKVEAYEYREREKDMDVFKKYDMILVGSPVYYYDVPENFQKWLGTIPRIDGKAVASFVTFGSWGDNQHNTACTLLELLAQKGGIPMGMNMFGNLSTYSLDYGDPTDELKYRNNPNQKTYDAMGEYTRSVLKAINNGQSFEVKKEVTSFESMKGDVSIQYVKKHINKHTIDQKKCVGCNICVEKCPVGAIDPTRFHVNTDRCIACLGCVNNCPEQAVDMAYDGEKIYGYYEFLRRHNIKIPEPRFDG